MLQASLQSLGGNTLTTKLMGTTTNLDDEKDLEEDTYEQQEEKQQTVEVTVQKEKSMTSNLDDDMKEELVSDEQEEEQEEESIDVSNEEELVNSTAFAKEFESAIEHISDIAKSHREEMIASARKQMEQKTGTVVTDEMVSKAMKTFAVLGAPEEASAAEESSDAAEVDEDELNREMEEALEAVRELAAQHQPVVVDGILDIYAELNDEEASLETVSSLFRGIRSQFVQEAVGLDSDVDSLADFDAEFESLAEEMGVGLCAVRAQAQLDQEGLVHFICDSHRDLNGCEPSVDILVDILDRIKGLLAEEARDEFLEMNQDEDDEEDSDYEVDEDSDAEQYAEDEAEDIYIAESDSAEVSASESAAEIDDDEAFEYLVEIEDEEELVNDPVFGELFCSAMEHIESIGREDGVSMVLDIVEQYEEETGQRVTEEMVEVAVAAASTTEDVDAESEDEEELAIEMQEAVDRARELGALHREQLVNRICDLYAEENGEEMSLQKLYAIFGDIEQGLAEEDEEDVTGELDADSFAVEFQSAIDDIQMLAKQDQEEMVDALCDIYCDYNGEEPSTPELYEMFADIKASFVEEAVEDLIENELEVIETEYEDESDDEDYSPDSDAYDYSVDAVDDVLYHDSESEEDSDSDYDVVADRDTEKDAAYQQDVDDDLPSSTESESEQKASELQPPSDSEYSPEKDAADYFQDYRADQVWTDSDASASADLSGDASHSEATDSGDADGQSDADSEYDPNYDLTDYLMDYEPFQREEEEGTDSDDEDYSVGKDEYDYSQDVEADMAESSEDSKASQSEQEEEENEDVGDEVVAA